MFEKVFLLSSPFFYRKMRVLGMKTPSSHAVRLLLSQKDCLYEALKRLQ